MSEEQTWIPGCAKLQVTILAYQEAGLLVLLGVLKPGPYRMAPALQPCFGGCGKDCLEIPMPTSFSADQGLLAQQAAMGTGVAQSFLSALVWVTGGVPYRFVENGPWYTIVPFGVAAVVGIPKRRR